MAGAGPSVEQQLKDLRAETFNLRFRVNRLEEDEGEIRCSCDDEITRTVEFRVEAMLHHARLRTKDAAADDLLTLLLDGLYAH